MTRPRHHCGRYASMATIWVGFGRSIEVLHCEPCERFRIKTNQLRREVEAREFYEIPQRMAAE